MEPVEVVVAGIMEGLVVGALELVEEVEAGTQEVEEEARTQVEGVAEVLGPQERVAGIEVVAFLVEGVEVAACNRIECIT